MILAILSDSFWRDEMLVQVTLFDWQPSLQLEPDIGALVAERGVVIPHIMRRSYIGKKVCFDVSTQHRRCFRVGVLEEVLDDFYFELKDGEYKKVPCDRVVIFTGKRQRSLISLMPGIEINECLPWEAYPERNKVINGNHDQVR